MYDEDVIQDNIENENFEIANNEVICPYCGYSKTVEYDFYWGDECPDIYEEGEDELTCPECNHRFILTKEMTWSYKTQTMRED